MNSPAERIFPPPPARDGHIVRTQFVGSWEAQFRGTGRLTAFITDHLLRFSAALDDAGLSLVYMQRHRLELGLKLLLERSGAAGDAIAAGHDLAKLQAVCETVIGSGTHAERWKQFRAEHDPLIQLISEVDRQSIVFRYPVGRDQRPLTRPPLIDLEELERATSSFHASVDSLVDHFAREEGLEIDAEEQMAAAEELEAAIRAIRTSRAVINAMDNAVAELHDQVRIGPKMADPVDAKTAEVLSSREEHFARADALLVPLTRSLELIRGRPEAEIEPDPLPQPPRGSLRHPLEIKKQLDETIEWVAKVVGESVGELGRALRAVYERSEYWPGIAARQLHEDLGGFLTRIHPALVEHAAKRVTENANEGRSSDQVSADENAGRRSGRGDSA